MNRLLLPLLPAALIGLVAHGTGFKLPDSVLVALGVWSVFVIFRRLMTVTTAIVMVCVLGALSQVDWYGESSSRYVANDREASPGTFTHLVKTIYRSVEDEIGIPHAPVSVAQAVPTPTPMHIDPTPAPGATVTPVIAMPAAQSSASASFALASSSSPAIAAAPPASPTASSGFAARSASRFAPVVPAPAASPVSVTVALPTTSTPDIPISVAGQPRVVGAATLYVDGRLIHLLGVSSPQAAVDCWRNGHPVRCEIAAVERLSQLIGVSRVSCTGSARGGGIEARCGTAIVEDLGKAMLDEGWVVLNSDAGSAYKQVASSALGNRRGLWAANFSRADQIEPSFTTLRR